MKLDSGKLPGKSKFSGRRRSVTRKSGFKSHKDTTGGEFKIISVPNYKLKDAEVVEIVFEFPKVSPNKITGYGLWYCATESISVEIIEVEPHKKTFTSPSNDNWSKIGAMWVCKSNEVKPVKVRFTSKGNATLSVYEAQCGIIEHKHLDWAIENKPVLLKNMYQFAPEGNFYVSLGRTNFQGFKLKTTPVEIYIKSCNRCARFLPININDERRTLSFSNHCVADHRRPCSHAGFGRLHNLDSKESLNLDYGYQLECRFCKKFEVNAAHNPQRTSAQMKEDGARRRSLELLLTELYDKSPLLRYRENNDNRELADDVWAKFKGKCFNCNESIANKRTMHLDHTRPLALLWPIDGTATCLCGSCNSQKRDRSPVDFYSKTQLLSLSKITGIPYKELLCPVPNIEAINLLKAKVDWFFSVFCNKPYLTKERDGKVAVELFIKALQKTLNKCPGGAPFNIEALFKVYKKKSK